MTKPKIKALILDMDGVLWRAYEPIVDLELVFKKIIQLGLKFAFATNNSTKHISTYVDKLQGYKIPVTNEQIISSSIATAQYLRKEFPNEEKVFIVGEDGMVNTFGDYGFRHSQDSPVAVVVGLCISLNYEHLAIASSLIRNGVKFIGTNADRTFPIPGGFAPGAGSLIAFIEAASGVKPEIVGKPNELMFQQALEYLGVQASETLVIGDRLETDILGGQNAGCQTALMLSGVSTLEAGENWKPRPDHIIENLLEMVKKLEND